MKSIKIIIEKHADGYIAYPLGLKGVVIGEGDSYEEALADVRSAIRFHIETFWAEALEDESPVLEAFIAEAESHEKSISRLTKNFRRHTTKSLMSLCRATAMKLWIEFNRRFRILPIKRISALR